MTRSIAPAAIWALRAALCLVALVSRARRGAAELVGDWVAELVGDWVAELVGDWVDG